MTTVEDHAAMMRADFSDDPDIVSTIDEFESTYEEVIITNLDDQLVCLRCGTVVSQYYQREHRLWHKNISFFTYRQVMFSKDVIEMINLFLDHLKGHTGTGQTD